MQQRNLSKPEKFGHEKGHTAHEHLSQLQKNYFSKKLFGDFFNCFFFRIRYLLARYLIVPFFPCAFIFRVLHINHACAASLGFAYAVDL